MELNYQTEKLPILQTISKWQYALRNSISDKHFLHSEKTLII